MKFHPHIYPPSLSHVQCHGLWDEDDPKDKKEAPRQSESEDEGKDREKQKEKDKEGSEKDSEPASSVISDTRSSTHTLKSMNFGTSIDSGHVQVHFPQQQTYQRRKSSSGGSHISHRSLHSSARSKRGEPPFLFHIFLVPAAKCRVWRISAHLVQTELGNINIGD